MHKVTISFSGLGINNINQADVCIYDLDDNLIINKKTYNGRLNICLKYKCFYKILAKSKYETIKRVIYLNNDFIYLNFSNSLVRNSNSNFRIFYLTDYNYPNLPIKKGTIILG